MPLSFSLQRPTLPAITSWGTSPKADENDPTTPTPNSAPARTSQSSFNTSNSLSKRLSARSIRHTSLVVSRPTTPAKASPLSATFGLPGEEDDDPFGVRALEQAGLLIKEAGTKENHRPGSDAFQYRPSPNSPIWRSSMASAISKTSRPSLDGRASIMTGRRSLAHSRQSSVSEIGTHTEIDGLDGGSLRGMSPVREASQSRKTSPEDRRKTSPRRQSRFAATGERPPPLKLQHTTGDRRKNDDPSPRSRLSAVQEKVREIELEQKAREAKAQEEDKDAQKESDLDRLAREIREMAYEHEERERKSQEELHGSEKASSVNDAKPARGLTEEPEQIENDDGKVTSPESSEPAQPTPERAPKRGSTIVPEVNTSSAEKAKHEDSDESHHEEDDEDDDDDEDEEDYDSFDDEEEPVIIEEAVQTAAPVSLRPRNMAVQSLQARAQVVSIHMPPPPAIPSRNPRRPQSSQVTDGSSTPVTPDFTEDFATSPQPSTIPENLAVNSKPASVRSIPDNDSSSSYSLGNERDSFAEANHDVMSQTSHGSDVVETTPTRTKMMDPDFSRLDEQIRENKQRDDSSESVAGAVDVSKPANSPEVVSPAAGEQPTGSENPSTVSTKPSASATEQSAAPVVPERRRPFSFEAAADEESLNTPSIEATMQHGDDQPSTKHKSIETPKQTAGNEQPKRTGEPIIIPDLPEDDHSEYEEDFS